MWEDGRGKMGERGPEREGKGGTRRESGEDGGEGGERGKGMGRVFRFSHQRLLFECWSSAVKHKDRLNLVVKEFTDA